MIKAVPMTEKSWLLYKKTERCGIMRLTDKNEYVIMGGEYSGSYKNKKALKDALNEIVFEKPKTNKEQEKSLVGDFPVKHDTVFEIGEVDGLYPYTKIEGSTDIYVAGYFSVKNKEKWQTVFSPRLKTLEEVDFHGPYKSKIESDQEAKMENNK